MAVLEDFGTLQCTTCTTCTTSDTFAAERMGSWSEFQCSTCGRRRRVDKVMDDEAIPPAAPNEVMTIDATAHGYRWVARERGGLGVVTAITDQATSMANFASDAERDEILTDIQARGGFRGLYYTRPTPAGTWERVWVVGSDALVDFRPIGASAAWWMTEHDREVEAAEEGERDQREAYEDGVQALLLEHDIQVAPEDIACGAHVRVATHQSPAFHAALRDLEQRLGVRPRRGVREDAIRDAAARIVEGTPVGEREIPF